MGALADYLSQSAAPAQTSVPASVPTSVPDDRSGSGLFGFVGNIGADLSDLVGGLTQFLGTGLSEIVGQPTNVLKELASLGFADTPVQVATPAVLPHMASSIVADVNDRYFDGDIGSEMYDHPLSFVMDALSVAGVAGAAARAATGTGMVAGRLGTAVLGVERVAENARALQAFRDARIAGEALPGAMEAGASVGLSAATDELLQATRGSSVLNAGRSGLESVGQLTKKWGALPNDTRKGMILDALVPEPLKVAEASSGYTFDIAPTRNPLVRAVWSDPIRRKYLTDAIAPMRDEYRVLKALDETGMLTPGESQRMGQLGSALSRMDAEGAQLVAKPTYGGSLLVKRKMTGAMDKMLGQLNLRGYNDRRNSQQTMNVIIKNLKDANVPEEQVARFADLLQGMDDGQLVGMPRDVLESQLRAKGYDSVEAAMRDHLHGTGNHEVLSIDERNAMDRMILDGHVASEELWRYAPDASLAALPERGRFEQRFRAAAGETGLGSQQQDLLMSMYDSAAQAIARHSPENFPTPDAVFSKMDAEFADTWAGAVKGVDAEAQRLRVAVQGLVGPELGADDLFTGDVGPLMGAFSSEAAFSSLMPGRGLSPYVAEVRGRLNSLLGPGETPYSMSEAQAILWKRTNDAVGESIGIMRRRLGTSDLGPKEIARARKYLARVESQMASGRDIPQMLKGLEATTYGKELLGRVKEFLDDPLNVAGKISNEVKGSATFGPDFDVLMRFYRTGDFTTFVHEFGHALRRFLPQELSDGLWDHYRYRLHGEAGPTAAEGDLLQEARNTTSFKKTRWASYDTTDGIEVAEGDFVAVKGSTRMDPENGRTDPVTGEQITGLVPEGQIGRIVGIVERKGKGVVAEVDVRGVGRKIIPIDQVQIIDDARAAKLGLHDVQGYDWHAIDKIGVDYRDTRRRLNDKLPDHPVELSGVRYKDWTDPTGELHSEGDSIIWDGKQAQLGQFKLVPNYRWSNGKLHLEQKVYAEVRSTAGVYGGGDDRIAYAPASEVLGARKAEVAPAAAVAEPIVPKSKPLDRNVYVWVQGATGSRSFKDMAEAEKAVSKLQATAPKDAAIVVESHGNINAVHRFTMGDDGFQAWHRYADATVPEPVGPAFSQQVTDAEMTKIDDVMGAHFAAGREVPARDVPRGAIMTKAGIGPNGELTHFAVPADTPVGTQVMFGGDVSPEPLIGLVKEIDPNDPNLVFGNDVMTEKLAAAEGAPATTLPLALVDDQGRLVLIEGNHRRFLAQQRGDAVMRYVEVDPNNPAPLRDVQAEQVARGGLTDQAEAAAQDDFAARLAAAVEPETSADLLAREAPKAAAEREANLAANPDYYGGLPSNEYVSDDAFPDADFTLPKELSRSAPRYGYREGNFELTFASDYDRTAYVLARDAKKASKAAPKFRAAAEAAGIDTADLVRHGEKVSSEIKHQAAQRYGAGERSGVIDVPTVAREGGTPPVVAAAPLAPAKAATTSVRKKDVKLGETYTKTVSGKRVRVRIDAENVHGGWDGTNLDTGRKIRIRSAQGLTPSVEPGAPQLNRAVAESDAQALPPETPPPAPEPSAPEAAAPAATGPEGAPPDLPPGGPPTGPQDRPWSRQMEEAFAQDLERWFYGKAEDVAVDPTILPAYRIISEFVMDTWRKMKNFFAERELVPYEAGKVFDEFLGGTFEPFTKGPRLSPGRRRRIRVIPQAGDLSARYGPADAVEQVPVTAQDGAALELRSRAIRAQEPLMTKLRATFGPKAVKTDLKGLGGIARKMADKVKPLDASRARVIIDSWDKADEAVAKIEQAGFQVVGVDDHRMSPGPGGRRGLTALVADPEAPDIVSEIEIATPMFDRFRDSTFRHDAKFSDTQVDVARLEDTLARLQGSAKPDVEQIQKVAMDLEAAQVKLEAGSRYMEGLYEMVADEIDASYGTPIPGAAQRQAMNETRLWVARHLEAPLIENGWFDFQDILERAYLPQRLRSGARWRFDKSENSGFYGGKDTFTLDDERAAAGLPQPVYYPHIEAQSPSDFILQRSGQGQRKLAENKNLRRSRGSLFLNDDYIKDPGQAYSIRAARAIKMRDTYEMIAKIAQGFGRRIASPDDLLPGESLVAPEFTLKFFNAVIGIQDRMGALLGKLDQTELIGALEDLTPKIGREMAPDIITEGVRRALNVDEMETGALARAVTEAIDETQRSLLGVTRKGLELYAVPKVVSERLHESVRYQMGPGVRVMWDKLTQLWKNIVLYGRPAWVLNNMLSNTGFAAIGGVKIREILRAVLDRPYRDKITQLAEDAGMAEEVATSFGRSTDLLPTNLGIAQERLLGRLETAVGQKAMASRALRPFRSYADWIRRINGEVETAYRRVAFVEGIRQARTETLGAMTSEVNQFGRKFWRTKQGLESMMSEGISPTEARRAMDLTNEWFGDYTNLSPIARNIVRRFIFPFWSFYRHVGRLLIKLPGEYPAKTAFMRTMALAANDMRNSQGAFPSWMANMIPFGPVGADGKESFVSLAGPNPFNVFQDTSLALLHPMLKVALEQITGRDAYTQREFTDPDVFQPFGSDQRYKIVRGPGGVPVDAVPVDKVVPGLATSILSQVPQYDWARSLVAGGRPYDTQGIVGSAIEGPMTNGAGQPVSPFGLDDAALRLLVGTSPTSYDVAGYRERLAKEREDALMQAYERWAESQVGSPQGVG